MKAQVWDKAALITSYGGSWCGCIDKIVDDITPAKVAAYCIGKKYPAQHPPHQDDISIRYAYYLKTIVEHTVVSDKHEIDRERRIITACGDFKDRPYETLKSCLDAIIKLSEFEERPAQEIAEEIAKADESLVPEADQKGILDEDQRGILYGGQKRTVIDSGYKVPG
jgi:hypothetical protein